MDKCLKEGGCPSSWKRADLVLFNKVDKDGSDASSYRPICLLPAWSKVLDKLVINRLDYHVQSQSFIHRNQFGFTPGKGTEHAPHELRKTIDRCVQEVMTAASPCWM